MNKISELVTQIANLRKTRSGKFAIAGIISTIIIICCILPTLVLSTDSPEVEPTLDVVSINVTAIYEAWLPYTQTAAALPTATCTETLTPLPTDTLAPTITPFPTYTKTLVPTSTLVPYVAPTIAIVPQQPPSQSCCKVCRTGKACGDSCISRDKTCNSPPGCACNG